MNVPRIVKAALSAAVFVALAACAATPKQEGTGEYIDDTVITTRVKTALLNDPEVSGLAVNVETFKGTVQLSGFVKSASEKSRAASVAGKVPGVKQVRNDIVLR